MKVINIKEKLSQFDDFWNPRIAGRLNGQLVKLAKFKGEFIWHKHDHEDEMFLVITGEMKMEFENRTQIVNPGEFIIVPKGTMHKPCSDDVCEIMLFEPKTTLNTGDQKNHLTRENLSEI